MRPDRAAPWSGESGQYPIQLRVLVVSTRPIPTLPGAESVERVESVDEALLQLGRAPYDVVAVDLSCDEPLLCLDAIGARAPHVALVALTLPSEREKWFDAWRRGAQECLSAETLDPAELQHAARHALERKWLTNFLEHRVKLLEGAFSSISPGIAVLDAEGQLVTANRSWAELAERTDDALSSVAIGSTFFAELDGSDLQQARELSQGIRLVLSGRLPALRVELPRVVDGDARWFLVQVDAMPDRAGVVVTTTDINDRHHAEEALRRSEVDHRRLLEDLPQGVAIQRDGVFLWANRVALQLLGYDGPEQIVGRRLAAVVHPDDAATTFDADAPRDIRLLRADGETTLAEVRVLPVAFDGSPASMFLASDVGERRGMTARMMELDRMSSAGLLAAALGHEIKNPLSFVSANVDVALRDAASALRTAEGLTAGAGGQSESLRDLTAVLREIRGALQDARQGARRVEAVVDDLRAFSRPEQRQDQPVDVERVMAAAINMTRNEIRHRAQLIKEYAPVPPVRASEAQLGQVFLNLLTNAVDAIEVGDAARNSITIALRAEDGHVVIEVRDTGCGIPAQGISRVFDAFYTTKPVGRGTGIGLAICRNILQGLGGSIELRSAVGSGTTVRLVLPAAAEAKPIHHPSTISPLKPLDDALTVLVVDDEPLMGRAIARCLGKQHRVRWLSSGQEAIALLSKERFDVIFLDVMMPDMTGIEVFERLRADLPHVLPSIAFVTGGAFTPAARQFLESVPNTQVAKPFEAQQIRLVAQEVAYSGRNDLDRS